VSVALRVCFETSTFMLLPALACTLVVALGCATPGSDTPVSHAEPPDWIASGGKTPRYDKALYVSGFAMVEIGLGHGGVPAAKQQAVAAMSRKISVRIQASLRDVTESRDGTDSYWVASIVNSTSDIQLSGVDYEVHCEAARCYALAYLARGRALTERRELRGRSLAEVRACLASGSRHEQAGRDADAIDTYESCRGSITEALEHDSVARVLGAGGSDGAAYAELVAASRAVDDKVRAIEHGPASSLSEAIERLGIKLRRQGAAGSGRIVVAPFTYGTTDLSSVFGRQVGIELESVIARGGQPGPAGQRVDVARQDEAGGRVIRGVYLERDDEIRITATVRDTGSGRLVASAETTLPRHALPAGVSLRPANFEAALRDQKILAEGELLSGDLQVEVWTDRGRRGVVYSEAEELTVHYRVNQPAWVRLIYVLQSGEKVPIAAAWYVDAAKVNQVLTYPDSFEIVPPFGVEHIHATAFSSKPDELLTEHRMISGEPYEVVADGLKQIVKTRGIKRKKREALAESLVTVTTMPN
jgi:hypothetical protein